MYTEIKFSSRKIIKNDNGYVALGDIEIHGIVNQVSIQFSLYEKIN